MRVSISFKILALAVVLISAPHSISNAAVVYEPESEFFSRLNRQMDSIAATLKLTAEEAKIVKKAVAIWYHLGPCKRPEGLIAHQLSYDVLSMAMNLKPSDKFHAAFLQMIGLLMTENFGRAPPKNLCDYATSLAESAD